MNKKSQVTFFIILGIVIVIIVASYFLIRSAYIKRAEKEIVEIPLQIQPIKNYIDNCLKKILTPGIYLLGIQGGYIYLPQTTLKSKDYEIAYSLYYGNYNLISISNMEKQISTYMNNELPKCFDFSVFEEQGFKIISQDLNTETTIAEDNVFVDISYNLDIEKERTQHKLDRFTATVPIRLGHIHTIADEIVKKSVQDPDWIDITHLASFDISISIIPYNKTDSIYAIVDNTTTDNIKVPEPFIFLIANNHIINDPPQLELPSTFTLNDSKPFIYQVNAPDPDNDILTFSDNTAMFDITEDGIISFIPEVKGNFPVLITVEDTHRNYDSKEVLFIVT